MNRRTVPAVHLLVEAAASLAFADAVGFSLMLLGAGDQAAMVGAALGGIAALAVVARTGNAPARAPFAPVPCEFAEPTDDEADVLLLEDRLDQPTPHSSVVRLFAVDGKQVAHAPGDLAARIDQYLAGPAAPRAAQAQQDAAQELSDALAQIRASLR